MRSTIFNTIRARLGPEGDTVGVREDAIAAYNAQRPVEHTAAVADLQRLFDAWCRSMQLIEGSAQLTVLDEQVSIYAGVFDWTFKVQVTVDEELTFEGKYETGDTELDLTFDGTYLVMPVKTLVDLGHALSSEQDDSLT